MRRFCSYTMKINLFIWRLLLNHLLVRSKFVEMDVDLVSVLCHVC